MSGETPVVGAQKRYRRLFSVGALVFVWAGAPVRAAGPLPGLFRREHQNSIYAEWELGVFSPAVKRCSAIDDMLCW